MGDIHVYQIWSGSFTYEGSYRAGMIPSTDRWTDKMNSIYPPWHQSHWAEGIIVFIKNYGYENIICRVVAIFFGWTPKPQMNTQMTPRISPWAASSGVLIVTILDTIDCIVMRLQCNTFSVTLPVRYTDLGDRVLFRFLCITFWQSHGAQFYCFLGKYNESGSIFFVYMNLLIHKAYTGKLINIVIQLSNELFLSKIYLKFQSVCGKRFFNSLGPGDTIWQNRTVSLAQVMSWCLMAPSHYLNQWWQIISEILKISILDISLKKYKNYDSRHISQERIS